MKKTAILFAAPAAFALAACGNSTDASEDAVADNVEVPADTAMEDVPEPVADAELTTEEETPAEQEPFVTEENANNAADAAQSTVDDALAAAEAAQAEQAADQE